MCTVDSTLGMNSVKPTMIFFSCVQAVRKVPLVQSRGAADKNLSEATAAADGQPFPLHRLPSQPAILPAAEVCRWHAGWCVRVRSGRRGVKLAAGGVFAAGRQAAPVWLGLPPNRCWFVSEPWLNSWTALRHTGRGGD